VGSTNLAINASVDFNNPVNGTASLLIHLPSNSFVAYERACTHQGVAVHYDAATHTLVCPAHGAIFDPANGGKVLQGPATRPLPPVTVLVNADGTITAG
jgi:Rieske Fe-S protein